MSNFRFEFSHTHGFLKSGDIKTILAQTPLKGIPMKFYLELASLKAD